MKKASLLLFALTGLHLQASTVIVTFNGEITSESIQRDVGDGAGFVGTTTGEFSFTRTGGTDVGDPTGTFFAFCIEPREFVTDGGTYTYDLTTLDQGTTNIGGMGAAKADLIRELFGRYYPVIGAPIDAEHASAIQIAIWEIVRENSGTLNVATGNVVFQSPADPAALALAQTYLNSLDGTGPKDTDLFALTEVGAQDVVVQLQAHSTEAPEPVTFASVGLALIGLALTRRKRSAAR
jgi:hypothetical protein